MVCRKRWALYAEIQRSQGATGINGTQPGMESWVPQKLFSVQGIILTAWYTGMLCLKLLQAFQFFEIPRESTPLRVAFPNYFTSIKLVSLQGRTNWQWSSSSRPTTIGQLMIAWHVGYAAGHFLERCHKSYAIEAFFPHIFVARMKPKLCIGLPCRFQGVDWRKKKNWECNQRMNPTGEKWMDGFTLSQYELMFVKVKDHLRFSTNSLSLNAIKYSDWMDGLVSFYIPSLCSSFCILFEI